MKRSRAVRLGKTRAKHFRRVVVARDFGRLLTLKLERMFPEVLTRMRASALLEQYGGAPNEPKVERVRLAILRRAGTDLEKIAATLVEAKEDYEDTIALAESPEETRCHFERIHLHEGDLRRVRDNDKRQYEDWLTQDTH